MVQAGNVPNPTIRSMIAMKSAATYTMSTATFWFTRATDCAQERSSNLTARSHRLLQRTMLMWMSFGSNTNNSALGSATGVNPQSR